jgi:hypothetical protein
MLRHLAAFAILVAINPVSAYAADQFYPDTSYDSSIPSMIQVTGHDWGERVTSPRQIEAYLQALEKASPRAKLVRYGQTWQGRPLYYLVIASEENMARLEDIQAAIRKLADPRLTPRGEADRIIEHTPAVTWLAYGVHGNEISSPEAGLLTAYHLLAAKDDPLAASVLRETVVIIDPLQNPDGRERFCSYYEQNRARWPDPDQQAAEHNEVWPGGRFNHYLFDMNRDWFALTQKESQARVRAFLEWFPQVFVDLHEMGSDSSYFFAPPAPPRNPEYVDSQVSWMGTYGRNNAEWFDRMGFEYFTGEVFDYFYPGYGEGWPMFQGAIGMTYEQASTRGLVVRKADERLLVYRQAIQHHFIASLATAETTARNRAALLSDFYSFRASAIEEGKSKETKEFILEEGADPGRAAKLVATLMAQGIEVRRASAPFSNDKVRDYYSGQTVSKNFPAGTYIVPGAQPARRLASTLLSPGVPMEASFVEEQIRRYAKRMQDQIYDVTSWSLPYLFDVPCYEALTPSPGSAPLLTAPPQVSGGIRAGIAGGNAGGNDAVAYLVPWGSNAAARLLGALLQQEIRVHTAGRAFDILGRSFSAGSLVIRVRDNPADLHEKLEKLAVELGVEIFASNTSWVAKGINLGSDQVRLVKRARVAMAYNMPVSPASVGATRYLLEEVVGYPVTIIHALQLPNADLSGYDVLILPNASSGSFGYAQAVGEAGAKRIQEWIRGGGTLITFAEASRWLTDPKVALLDTFRELKGGLPDKPPEENEKKESPGRSEPFDLQTALLPEKELPQGIPGAILRIDLDRDHWLAGGYGSQTNVLVNSRNIFTPLKLDKGTNVGLYLPADKAVLSGFVWEDEKKQIANKAYLMHQALGRGHVVAFAEDPNFRAYSEGTSLLFLNALFFGPAY